jgi:hypothetical protein
MDAEDAIKSYERETPIVKLIYDTYQKSVKDSLEKNYFPKFGNIKKWKCFSDYSFDKNKPNDIITFTLLPYVADMQIVAKAIKFLSSEEIKKTSTVNPKFIEFIKESPFVTFSFIVQNHKHLFLPNRDLLKEAMMYSMSNLLITDIPDWILKRPYLTDYFEQIAMKVRKVIKLLENDKKIKILKNLFLTTSIGSVICTQFANRTEAEILGWFSDRDEINEVADNFSIDLFSIQFAEHLLKWDCKFAAAPAKSVDDEWYAELIKIPDFITGAIADYDLSNNQVSHKKFVPLFHDLICDNDRNIFVFRLTFNEDSSMACARVLFHKELLKTKTNIE